MRKELSCGIIPVKKSGTSWEVLLVQLHAGHWGFPKGHIEDNEELKHTAIRELFEETGLQIVRLLSEQTFEEAYHFRHLGELIDKKVIYFLAEVAGHLTIQAEEIKAAKWVALEDAEKNLTFPASKKIAQEALKTIYG